jgi:signal transduction histidine kinase
VRHYTVAAAAALGVAWQVAMPTLLGLPPGQRTPLRAILLVAASVLILASALVRPEQPAGARPLGLPLPLRGVRWLAGVGSALGGVSALAWAAVCPGGLPAGPQSALALAAGQCGLALAFAVGLAYALFWQQTVKAQAAPIEPEPVAADAGAASGQYAPLPTRSPAAYAVASYVDLLSAAAAGLTLGGWLLCAGHLLSRPGGAALGTSLLAVAPALAALVLLIARAACSDTARDLRALADELDQLGLHPSGSAPALAEAVSATGQLNQLYATVDELRRQLNQHIAAYYQELRLAEEADRRRTEFTSDVGRELRVPVQALLADVERMQRGDDGALTERQREAADVLHKSAAQLHALLAEVFDAAVLEGGLRLGKRTPVHVGTVARELLRLLRPLVSGGQVRLRLQVDPRTPPAYADALAVRRILGNLVSNAVKFTEAGEITVAVRPLPADDGDAAGAPPRPKPMIEVQVRDTGPGIARGELDRLFEEFSQGSTPRRAHIHGGIGLGLAIARRLTELHGGRITASSEPGSGATFTFTLPVATLDEVASSAAAAPAPGPGLAAVRVDPDFLPPPERRL